MTLGFNPHFNVDEHDTEIRNALNVIWSTFGDNVSVENKQKSLFKFGRNNNVGSGDRVTIAEWQDTGVTHETLLTENKIAALVSSDTGDAGTVFKIEGHTLDTGTGFEFVVQSVTCNGQTPAPLDTPLARATRVFIPNLTWPNEARPPSGTIYVYDTGGTSVTSGVPDTPSATKLLMVGDTGEEGYQSQKCATAISATDYWIVTGVGLSITRDNSQTTKLSAEIEYKTLGGVWRPLGVNVVLNTDVESYTILDGKPYIIIPKNTDVRMTCISSRADTEVTGWINGYLAKVIQED